MALKRGIPWRMHSRNVVRWQFNNVLIETKAVFVDGILQEWPPSVMLMLYNEPYYLFRGVDRF